MNIENFTGKAENYAKGRPSYPEAAIEYICSLTPHNAIFADIGAGTGKFTVKLAERDYSVFAVEPNTDMRKQLAVTLDSFPNVKIINGTAETTTLPENSVDVITVAHALHWFNLDIFRSECQRIVKPGGLVIAIYNITPNGDTIHFSQPAIDSFFLTTSVMEFPNPIEYTRDNWLAYIASQDGYPASDEPGYDEHISAINAGFDRGSVDGLLHIDKVTKIYSEKFE